MNYFGTTVYDPIEGSSSSIDPLNSLSVSVNLAEMVFPGSSGRIWKPRYISALCFLVDCARTSEGEPYKDNYLTFRTFENAFILACTLLQQKGDPGLSGFMGSLKASNLIENSQRGGIDITGEILSNQMNLGPLGVHQVLLRNLGLIQKDNLVLTIAGKELADLYKKNMKSDAQILQEVGSKRRADLDKLRTISAERFSFSIGLNAGTEAKIILDLLLEDPKRAQLLKDLEKISNPDGDIESQLIHHLPNEQKSSNWAAYQLIHHFDEFQKYLHWGFYHFIEGEFRGEKSIVEIQRLKQNFPVLKSNLLKYSDLFLKGSEEISTEERYDLRSFIQFLENVQASLQNEEMFAAFLIGQHHINHQKGKNKAPWVSMKSGKVLPTPANMVRSDVLESMLESRLHRYRYANAFSLLKTLKAA